MAATIGEVLDWRAQLRANDIARRPSPSAARPDRGYVDQAPPSTPRAPAVIPLARLEEAQRVSEEDNAPSEVRLTPPPPPAPAEPPRRRIVSALSTPIPTTAAPMPPPPPSSPPPPVVVPEQSSIAAVVQLLTPPPPPPEVPEFRLVPRGPAMPRGVRKVPAAPGSRRVFPESVKLEAIRRVMRGGAGAQAKVGRAMNINQATISLWVKAWKERNPGVEYPPEPGSEKTQLSRPEPEPASRVRAPSSQKPVTNGAARSVETIARELQDALERVRSLKAEMRDLLTD